MSDERLRRLDAMFAERVLECKVRWAQDGYEPGEPRCGCANSQHADPSPHCCTGECRAEGFEDILKPYSSSLTAAWEGIIALNANLQIERYPHGIEMNVDAFLETGGHSGDACAGHPAEALVLACLRAKGVSEEELK